MDFYAIILAELVAVVEAEVATQVSLAEAVRTESRLEDLSLDSLGYTSLLTILEEKFGFIPTKILQGVWFPDTFGDLVAAYEEQAMSAESAG